MLFWFVGCRFRLINFGIERDGLWVLELELLFFERLLWWLKGGRVLFGGVKFDIGDDGGGWFCEYLGFVDIGDSDVDFWEFVWWFSDVDFEMNGIGDGVGVGGSFGLCEFLFLLCSGWFELNVVGVGGSVVGRLYLYNLV